MDFTIYPLKGANAVEFGMRSAQVKRAMNAPCVSGDIRAVSKEFPTDFFEEAGVFAYYDVDGFLDALEFVRPSRPLLGKVNVFSLPFGQAAAMLARLDPEVVSEPDAVLSRQLSLSIWSPELPDGDHVPIESFLVGRPGYYDED